MATNILPPNHTSTATRHTTTGDTGSVALTPRENTGKYRKIQPQNAQGLTLPMVTPKPLGSGSNRVTRHIRRRAKKCKVCGERFTGSKQQKYCSQSCKQSAYRRRHIKSKPSRKMQPASRPLTPATCIHCGSKFWTATRRQKYCSPSCRELCYRIRRNSAVQTVAVVFGVPVSKVADTLEVSGTRRLTTLLQSAGYAFDTTERVWMHLDTG